MPSAHQLRLAGEATSRTPGRAPQILYVTGQWPHLTTCASELRSLHIARALREFARLEIVVVGDEERSQEWEDIRDKEFRVAYNVPVRAQAKEGWPRKLRWLLNPRVNYPHHWGVDEETTGRVLRSSGQCDLIWFCKLSTANGFPHWAWPRSMVDIDDVPSTYQLTVCRTETRLLKRLAATARFLRWRRCDSLLGERFSVLGVCSKGDKRYLEKLGVKAPLHVIPNGFERPSATPVRRLGGEPRLGFIGNFNYLPNREGVRWFIDQCWPGIKREIPNARFRLVGNQSDGSFKPVGLDVEGLGWIANPAEEIASWSAMVVPIHLAAGTRGKVAYAFSLKCPVVSTPQGAYGYEHEAGDVVFLAKSAEEFASACITAIRQPVQAAQMAERAWHQFLENWTWEAIRPRVWEAAEDCLRRSAPREG